MSPRVQTLNKCATATGAAFGYVEEDYATVHRAASRRFGRLLAFLLIVTAGGYAIVQKLGLPNALAQITGSNRMI